RRPADRPAEGAAADATAAAPPAFTAAAEGVSRRGAQKVHPARSPAPLIRRTDEMTRAYAVVVRRAERNYPADCADVPGCVATGRETRPPVGRAMETSASFEARSA